MIERKTKKPKEMLECVVAIRLSEKVKSILIKEAHAEKNSLSNHILNLINAGWEATRESELANVEGANRAETRPGKVEAENVNFPELMKRLDEILKQAGKDETRELIDRVLEMVGRHVVK